MTRPQKDRLEIFVRGVEILRWLTTDEVSRADAVAAGINYREWYRWLSAFRRLGLHVERIWRTDGRGPAIPYYTCSKSDWQDLLDQRKHITLRPRLPVRAPEIAATNG